jgi:hypothetical protein
VKYVYGMAATLVFASLLWLLRQGIMLALLSREVPTKQQTLMLGAGVSIIHGFFFII